MSYQNFSEVLQSIKGTNIGLLLNNFQYVEGLLVDVKDDHLVVEVSGEVFYVVLQQIGALKKNTKDYHKNLERVPYINRFTLNDVLSALKYKWITLKLKRQVVSGVLSSMVHDYIVLINNEERLYIKKSQIVDLHYEGELDYVEERAGIRHKEMARDPLFITLDHPEKTKLNENDSDQQHEALLVEDQDIIPEEGKVSDIEIEKKEDYQSQPLEISKVEEQEDDLEEGVTDVGIDLNEKKEEYHAQPSEFPKKEKQENILEEEKNAGDYYHYVREVLPMETEQAGNLKAKVIPDSIINHEVVVTNKTGNRENTSNHESGEDLKLDEPKARPFLGKRTLNRYVDNKQLILSEVIKDKTAEKDRNPKFPPDQQSRQDLFIDSSEKRARFYRQSGYYNPPKNQKEYNNTANRTSEEKNLHQPMNAKEKKEMIKMQYYALMKHAERMYLKHCEED